MHVFPTTSESQFSFANAAAHVDQEDLVTAADAIRAELRAQGRTEVV